MKDKKRIYTAFITVALALVTGIFYTIMPGTTEAFGVDESEFVKRDGAHLTLDGEPFYFASTNNYYLFYKTQAMIDEILDDAKALGLRVVRTWGSCEGNIKDTYCFQPEPGVYDEPTFQKLDYIVAKAKACGIRLIIPFVNNWDDNFGGIRKYTAWSPTAKARISFDIYNPGGVTDVALAVSTGTLWDWHESLPQAIATGWNHVTFTLDSNDWKCEASGWEYTSAIAGLDDVKQLSIGVYGHTASGSVYVDNIYTGTASKTLLWDGAEEVGGWHEASAWSDASSVALSNMSTQGYHSLELVYDASKGNGKAFWEIYTDISNHDIFYFDETCRTLYTNYIYHMLNRVNTITGVAYKHEPAIMMWELANEPRCESDPSGDTLQAWIEDVAAYIKTEDPYHLLSVGLEGWYNGSGTDYIRNNQCTNIDACSFHLFPNDYIMSEEESKEWIEDHIRDGHTTVGKPVYLGEFGWRIGGRTDIQKEEVLHSFGSDTEGWDIHWGYTAGPAWAGGISADGNGSIQYTASFSGWSTAGGRVWYGTSKDLSGYEYVSGWVRVPDAPPGTWIEVQLYAESGPTNEKTWSSDLVKGYLWAGHWYLLKLPVAEIPYPSQVNSLGIQVKSDYSTYTGEVYYDLIEAYSGTAVRDRVYKDWTDLVYAAGGDGAGFWDMVGHQEDGDLYPDYYLYSVYYPEDLSTCAIISKFASDMSSKVIAQSPRVTVGDIDGNGGSDAIIDFGASYGIWIWHDDGTWLQITAVDPESIT